MALFSPSVSSGSFVGVLLVLYGEDQMAHMLIVSPDGAFASALAAEALRQNWQAALTCEIGQTMRALYELQPAAVVLDTHPGNAHDPWRILARIREVCETPILVVNRDDTPDARITALERGADDAVSQPCTPTELVMRVRILSKHHVASATAPSQTYDDGVLSYDAQERSLAANGTHVALSPGESRLLVRFLREPDRFLSYEELTEGVWGDLAEARSNVIKVYVHRLRRKIRSVAPEQHYITNNRAVGYRFR
jgi:DNA-binding response OmpR family regulator